MSCADGDFDKKEFGTAVYKRLRELYGPKDAYEVSQIESVVSELGYPDSYNCWALIAFMLTANADEYFRVQGTPMDVLTMKRAFISEMTDGEKDTLSSPMVLKQDYGMDLDSSNILTDSSLMNYFAARAGFDIGVDIAGIFI